MASPVYVRMTDTALSGWGDAAGGKSVYVVECDTSDQVDQIMKAAEARPEMKRIQFCLHKPRARNGNVISLRHYNDLGPGWKK